MTSDKATRSGRKYDVTPLRFCPECPFTEWTEKLYCPDCGSPFFPNSRKGSRLRPREEPGVGKTEDMIREAVSANNHESDGGHDE